MVLDIYLNATKDVRHKIGIAYRDKNRKVYKLIPGLRIKIHKLKTIAQKRHTFLDNGS